MPLPRLSSLSDGYFLVVTTPPPVLSSLSDGYFFVVTIPPPVLSSLSDGYLRVCTLVSSTRRGSTNTPPPARVTGSLVVSGCCPSRNRAKKGRFCPDFSLCWVWVGVDCGSLGAAVVAEAGVAATAANPSTVRVVSENFSDESFTIDVPISIMFYLLATSAIEPFPDLSPLLQNYRKLVKF
jgi:hypothetical protein